MVPECARARTYPRRRSVSPNITVPIATTNDASSGRVGARCQQPSDDSRGDDQQIPDTVVHAHRTSPLMARGEVDNERFACGLSEFLEASDEECREQLRKACRETHR